MLNKLPFADSRTKGFSIIESLIAISITIFAVLGIATMMNSMQKNQTRISTDTTRTTLVSNIRFNAMNALALYKTASTNVKNGESRLMSCICGLPSCAPNKKIPIALTDSDSLTIADGKNKVKFGPMGEACTGKNCFFTSEAWFTCLGTNCGTGTSTASDPILRIEYNLALSSKIKASRSEISMLKDVSGPPIDSAIASLKTYAANDGVCPSADTFSPTSGPTTGGTAITFTGNGLTQLTSVKIGGNTCSMIGAATNTQLQCSSPSGSAGPATVVINTTLGPVTLTQKYTYVAPPPPPPPTPPPFTPPATPTPPAPPAGPVCTNWVCQNGGNQMAACYVPQCGTSDSSSCPSGFIPATGFSCVKMDENIGYIQALASSKGCPGNLYNCHLECKPASCGP